MQQVYSLEIAMRMLKAAAESKGDDGAVFDELLRRGTFDGPVFKRALGRLPDLCEMHGFKLDEVLGLMLLDVNQRARKMSEVPMQRRVLDLLLTLEREESRMRTLSRHAGDWLNTVRKIVREEAQAIEMYNDGRYILAQIDADLADETLSEGAKDFLRRDRKKLALAVEGLSEGNPADDMLEAIKSYEMQKPAIEKALRAYHEIDERHSAVLLVTMLVQHLLATTDVHPSLELGEYRHMMKNRDKGGVIDKLKAIGIPIPPEILENIPGMRGGCDGNCDDCDEE